MRVVFHDQDDARAVVARLRADGFDAQPVRERFAGEDDDADHPWAVVSDAPAFALEILAEEYDGWVDHDDPPPSPGWAPGWAPGSSPGSQSPPLDLPSAPRRVKGHVTDGSRTPH